MLQVTLVQKRSTPLPSQGRHLPGLVLREQLHERLAPLLILSREQQIQIAFALDEFVFFLGAALEQAHQVLDTLLPRFHNLLDTNFVRHVADDRQALLVSFRCRSKVHIV